MNKDDFTAYLLASAYLAAKAAQPLVRDRLTFMPGSAGGPTVLPWRLWGHVSIINKRFDAACVFCVK